MGPGDDGVVRDWFGFAVKPEYRELYSRFQGIYADEEEQRSTLWEALLHDLADAVGPPEQQAGGDSCGGAAASAGPAREDDAALLARALTVLGGAAAEGDAPPHAAALLQRLSSLVQAGLPMAKRGLLWRLFLNVDAKRQPGEYARLQAAVQEVEGRGAAAAGLDGSPGPSSPGPGSPGAAAAAKPKGYCSPGAVYSLVADGSGLGAALHRVDTFSITPIAADESPGPTPAKLDGAAAAAEGGAGLAAPGPAAEAAAGDAALTPLEVPRADAADAASAPLATPASTLATPHAHSCSTASTSGGAEPGSAVADAAGDADAGGSGSPGCSGGSSAAQRTEERWRQQDFLAQIDKDLHRTFPGHPGLDANGRATLRRMLAAYSVRNPSVGYCQGLNFVAATLMLFMPEEDAFWCLCAVIEDLLGSSYFDERMVDVLVFGHLLQGRFPTLWAHLSALEVDAASVTMHWFLCCFLNSLPLDSTLRVWDLLFFEGSAVVLFRTALALVEIYDQALMTTRESSDAYMLLQCCAQMTFDSSRLVDTACCGYSHLQAAGLHVLRQRYRAVVLDNLRASSPSDEERAESVASQPCPADLGAASFAAAFRRASSALLDAEEAAQRQRQASAASPDGGHLSLPGSAAGGGSRRSSPGSLGGGSQPSSPLVRMRQAVSGLTSRLVLTSLPQLLPAGAVDASGQELSPMGSSGRPSPLQLGRGQVPGTAALRAPASDPPPGGVRTLRRISVGGISPSAGLGGGADGSGAVLGRRPPGLTPFSDVLLQQQEQQHAGSSAACTPQRQPSGHLPPRASGAAAGILSQPATPSDLLRPAQPPPSHRRAFTALYPTTAGGVHSRRRRRLTIDLLQMANVRPDLAQPALQAALAIAANPSPRAAAAALGRADNPFGSQPRSCLKPSPLGPGGSSSADAEASAATAAGEWLAGGCDALKLPIRALRFEDAGGDGSDGEGSGPSSSTGAVRRAATAPPLAQHSRSSSAELPVSQSALWRSSSSDDAQQAAAVGGDTGAADAACDGAAGALSTSAAAPSPSPASRRSTPGPSPLPRGAVHARKQSREVLMACVAALQEEFAIAESRRHAAEGAAAAAAGTAADLRRQLDKVQRQVEAKEALVAELAGRLEASISALADMDGKLAAAQMAAEAEAAAADAQRRQLAAADALIARLMDAQSELSRSLAATASGGGSAGGGGSETAVPSASAAASSTASSGSQASPQGSVGSAPRQL